MLTTAAAILAAAFCEAAEIGPGSGWTIVCGSGTKGVAAGLREISEAFADVLDEAVGAKVPVVSADKAPQAKGGRIFVGAEFARKAGLPIDDFRGWDNAQAEKDGDLYFYGCDRGGSLPDQTMGCVLPSAVAVSRFMTRRLGVLAVMPGKVGREVPRRAKLVVAPGFYERGTVERPYQAGRQADIAYNMANALYGRGAYHTYGGHTYGSACARSLFKTHPEYFGMDRTGKRTAGAASGQQSYCISNPTFQKMLIDELCKRFDRGADVCELGQNDGANQQCLCEECRKLYGTGDDWSEKFWCFHADIARRMAKLRPGKVLQIIAYGATEKPPKTFKVFPENVMVEICKYHEENLKAWSECTVPQGFTTYVYNWGWYQKQGFTAKSTVDVLVGQLRLFHKYGIRGIYRCGYGELFGMDGPAYWVYNRLNEDPAADPAAELSRYYDAAFGPAAPTMAAFYDELQRGLKPEANCNSTDVTELVEGTRSKSSVNDAIAVLSRIYTAERADRLERLLAKAEKTSGLSEKHLKRLSLVRLEWNYAQNMGEIARFYADYRKLPKAEDYTPLAQAIVRRNAMIADLYPDGKTMRKIDGWPELDLFQNPSLGEFRTNGRLSGKINDPLEWKVEQMLKYGIVPNCVMTPEERRAEVERKGLKPLTGFRLAEGAGKPGAFFEPTADGTGFRFGCGTNKFVFVATRVGEKQGFLPARTYCISWLTRWEHVDALNPWCGYDFISASESRPECCQVPKATPLKGTSPGWICMRCITRLPSTRGYSSEFKFRFWCGNTGVAEVRDLTIEEL